jgi:hypothetical protein
MSHFTFSRSLYDDCNIIQKDMESAGPFKWLVDKDVVESKESCFMGSAPFLQNPYNSVPPSSVDIESELRGQTRLLSRCPNTKYSPPATLGTNKVNECPQGINSALTPEYTRMNKSCNIFSGMSINRFHPLCEDLQTLNKIADNSIIGKNTRLAVKDAYKQ